MIGANRLVTFAVQRSMFMFNGRQSEDYLLSLFPTVNLEPKTGVLMLPTMTKSSLRSKAQIDLNLGNILRIMGENFLTVFYYSPICLTYRTGVEFTLHSAAWNQCTVVGYISFQEPTIRFCHSPLSLMQR